MTTIVQLRNKAVAYAVNQIRDGIDYQQIEWNLLNLEQFRPLMTAPDIEDLYDFIGGIIADADLTVEEERERNTERWEEYSNQYPELDDVMSRER